MSQAVPPDTTEPKLNRYLYVIVSINFYAMLIYRAKTHQITGGSGWARALFLTVALFTAYAFLFSKPMHILGFTVRVDAVGVRVFFFLMAIGIVVAAVFN